MQNQVNQNLIFNSPFQNKNQGRVSFDITSENQNNQSFNPQALHTVTFKNNENQGQQHSIFEDDNDFQDTRTSNIDNSRLQKKKDILDRDSKFTFYNNNSRKRFQDKKKQKVLSHNFQIQNQSRTKYNILQNIQEENIQEENTQHKSQNSIDQIIKSKRSQPLFKQDNKKYELEEYFSYQNEEACILAYDTFVKIHNMWQTFVFLPFGLCFTYDISKYKSIFQTNNRLKINNDALHQYNKNFNSKIQRVLGNQNTFNYVIQNNQKNLDIIRNVWSILIFFWLLWYFTQSVSGLKNINKSGTFWYINLIIILYRLMALIQFIVFSTSQTFLSFLIECKEICETQLIMWSDLNIQKQIQKSFYIFAGTAYFLILSNMVPYILTVFGDEKSVIHNKYIQDIQAGIFTIRVISVFGYVFASSCIIITRLYGIWQCYVIYIMYRHFFGICVSDYLDNDSQVVDFHNIQNIHAGIGYVVLKLNEKLSPLLSTSIFFITIFIGVGTYCCQKLFTEQIFYPYDWLQLVWWSCIGYTFSYFLWLYPQQIHNLNISLATLLQNEQHDDTSKEDKAEITKFATVISENPIAFKALGFELTKANLSTYYITTTSYLTAVLFFFKN